MRRSETLALTEIRHDILLEAGFRACVNLRPDSVVIEPLDQRLQRLARGYLSKQQRRELRRLLDSVDLTLGTSDEADDLVATLTRAKRAIDVQDETLDAVAQGLLRTGLVGEDRLQQAQQRYAETYVQERMASLQAEIDRALAAKREELRTVEASLRRVDMQLTAGQALLQEEKERLQAEFEQSLETKRAEVEAQLASQREELTRDRSELQRQQETLQRNLERVTTELREAGDEVVNRFLTIAPLLGYAGAPAANGAAPKLEERADTTAPPMLIHFSVPTFEPREARDQLSEQAFMDCFREVVGQSGFQYRDLDLIRFHLSLKVGGLTVLGGPSGTGKSSLPLLYGRALAGSSFNTDRTDCQMITVSPSWMDVRDLLGHVNTLQGQFYPAESGLYQRLIWAQEEYRARATATGLYVSCLDEMNLSQVEHYFSDFMTVLEREGEQRILNCFAEEAVSDACPFRAWSTIQLSPAVRFVGTVNSDETTRLLSDRLLDRVNFIRLSPGPLPALSNSDDAALARAEGRPVLLSDFQNWTGPASLPTDLAGLLDEMRPLLEHLGFPLSPRVYRAMCRFVGSSGALLSAPLAFDIQLAQRLAPRIRSLATRRQLDALDQLRNLLAAKTTWSFDETLAQLDEIRVASAEPAWLIDE